MNDSFRALAFEVMERSSKSFLDLASAHLAKYQEGAKAELQGKQQAFEETLKPLRAVMQQLDARQRELEQRREGAYSGLQRQIEQLIATDKELRRETALLASSLKSPQMRGSWGQIHLRRVIELAGLINHCDFIEQYNLHNEGRQQRPDLVIRLPGERQIVVDAKAPLEAMLGAAEEEGESERRRRWQEHASHLRKHIRELGLKEYWKGFDLSPDYVILFLPAESFFSAALQADPSLIEVGADQNVVIATPTTLIAILRAVAFTWKQESLSKSAKEIAKLGDELYERLSILAEHWSKVGRQLSTAVESYNQAAASMESRVLVSARKLKEIGNIAKEIKAPDPIESQPARVVLEKEPANPP
jgi:DNA recombination protein RmuC